MQIITIGGYLSRDAEQSTTRDGSPVTRLNIPVRQGWGEKEKTNWYRVSVWGKRADFAAKFRKGDFISVIGDLEIGEYQGKPQYEVRAHDFQSVNMAPKGDGSRGHAQNDALAGEATFADELSDEIPFISMCSVW